MAPAGRRAVRPFLDFMKTGSAGEDVVTPPQIPRWKQDDAAQQNVFEEKVYTQIEENDLETALANKGSTAEYAMPSPAVLEQIM